MHGIINGLIHFFGADSPNSPLNQLWEGPLGNFAIPNVTSFGVFWVLYKRHNCHQRGCWRVGRVENTGRIHCHKHHERNAA